MSAVGKQRRLYVVVGCFLCAIYALHLSFRRFLELGDGCVVPSPHRQVESPLRSASKTKAKWYDIKSITRNAIFGDEPVPELPRTDYFGCRDFEKLPNTTQSRRENNIGNRGISFIKVRINGATIPAVYKEANRVLNTYSEEYKYHMAIREIEYLKKLHGLPGIPQIFGSCIKNSSVTYLVERIRGMTFCNDNGTTVNCSEALFMLSYIRQLPDPAIAALKLTYSTVKLFRLLEQRDLFFEDISGVNLMFTPKFEVFLIDADSLVFYGETRLLSQMKCASNQHCLGPMGNLWVNTSLNARIHVNCSDLDGICEGGRCRGFDVALHGCALAEWFICRFVVFFDHSPKIQEQFTAVCRCMKEPNPVRRCSFASALAKMQKILDNYKSVLS